MKKENKGITLIALLITIIVMLILVGVSISMAVNGGLFNYAGKAAKETQNAIDSENELSSGRIQVDGIWYDTIEDYIAGRRSSNQGTGTNSKIPSDLKVGDYVNYTPTSGTYTVASGENGSGIDKELALNTTAELKWRVWSIDEETETVELVAETVGGVIYFGNYARYNHGVNILNDACKALYSNENGAVARSINVDDINSKTTYDPTEIADYGTTSTSASATYPSILEIDEANGKDGASKLLKESEGLRKTDGTADYETYTGSKTGEISVISTTYYENYSPETCIKSLGKNTVPVGLIDIGTEYWLASRGTQAGNVDTGADWWGLRKVDNGKVLLDICPQVNAGGRIKGSGSFSGSYIRPIVNLGSNATLTKDTENTTETNVYWNVEFK